MKGKRPAKAVALNTALLKKSGPPPALPARPAAGLSGGASGTSASVPGGFGSNGSNGTGGFGSNSNPVQTAVMYSPNSPFSSPRARPVTLSYVIGANSQDPSKGKLTSDLAHCFELHSGRLLGDKRNKEGRLYFKVGLPVFSPAGRWSGHICRDAY